MHQFSENRSNTITIVSVTGHQEYAQGSAYAIERSYEELQKKLPKENLKCLLVSPERPAHLEEYVEHISCQPFSYLEYNLFLLYSLGDIIDTDFALVVQNDGFVVDGHNWRNEFFDYDFIGAPLRCMYERLNDGSFKEYNNEQCDPFYENMPSNFFEGQNGGFSLRSKKLLKLPRELDIKIPFPIPDTILAKQDIRLEYTSNKIHNEDVVLTMYIRQLLIEHGIKFAPPIIACYFASESTIVHAKRNIPLEDVLGCHTFGYLILTDKNKVFMKKKVNFIENNVATNSWCAWFFNANMSIDVPQKFLEDKQN
ncbi:MULTISPECIES: DUF5672 family protein [Glaesserella]|uniref:DUF5672 domain-containing protein n=1 Tax=Glaesserella australis TaxID=2094024 RepID=A0A328BZ39_9PAST|nr:MULTISPECIES: DUF5672 family protein [Glaesserella]AUI66943.1 hypothetical protein CJD39_10345 [Glaesserella sp. 15-184]RAL19493.1 hypothetical protein C5N92_02220 [Glaesserella australis]